MFANLLLANVETLEALTSRKNHSLSSPITRDQWIILGGVLVLTVLLLVWAKYFRKPAKKSSSGESENLGKKVEKTISADGKKRIKVRKRRRTHRPRNPTLAETGGLPAPRSSADSTPETNGEQNHNPEKRF